jgi:DNA-binding CsgD family transcriptional regulator
VVLLGEGLLQLLALTAPLSVLVVEDAHHADPDTLALLEYLAAAITRRPALVVVVRRDWPRPDPLERLGTGPNVRQVRLARLNDGAVGDLVDAARPLPPEVRSLVVARSEGLPVVAVELAVAMSAQQTTDGWFVPESISALIDARMVALTEAEQRLLSAAAVLGESPDWELVPAVAGVDGVAAVAGFRRAVALHLLVAEGGALRWRHGLVHRAVWARLFPVERQELGRAAATLVLDQVGGSADPRAAELLFRVGDVDQAADQWLQLAREAAARGALRSADELLERVELTGRRAAAATTQRVELLTLSGRAADALSLGTAALLSMSGPDYVDLCLLLAHAAISVGRFTDAEDLVARSGRTAEPRSLILLADAAHGLSRVDEAARLAVEAVQGARQSGPPAVLCEALCAEARSERLHRVDRAAACFAEAARTAAEHGLAPWAVEANFGLATLELLRDESPRTLRQVRKTAENFGLLLRAAQANLLLADHLIVHDGPAGDTGPGNEVARYGRLLREPFLQFAAEVVLATRSALAGDAREMEHRLSALEAVPGLPADARAQLLAVRGLSALVHQDLDRAADLLDAALWPLAHHGSAAPLTHFGAWVLVVTMVGRAAKEVREVLAAQTAGQRRANRGALRYADAIVAGRRGEIDKAEEALREGDELLAVVPWWHRLLRLVTLTAAVADGWGDPVPQLRMDLTLYEKSGDRELVRWCRDLLREAGAPTRQGRGDSDVPAAIRASGVTSREMDVLKLLEEGLSNAEISSRLFVSSRTVETHVAHLLTKSGTANRQALRSWYRGLREGGGSLTR